MLLPWEDLDLRALSLSALLVALTALALPGAARADQAADFSAVITQILAQPYQAAYVATGFDSAFPMDTQNLTPVPNTMPAQDYTSGSVPGDPDHPNWPDSFNPVFTYTSGDGAPLRAHLALHAGVHPGIVVVHGFNTNGKESIIRWAAMLYANGYDVLASDQRDFKDESNNAQGYPDWLQTFGWKESQDVLAAGAYLQSQVGVSSIGILGFSEGAQNTILALAHDTTGIFSAGLTFSPPADQDTQIYSTADPPGCAPPSCQYPATDALVNLVVPPYGNGGKYFDACTVLSDAAVYYGTTSAAILAQESAYHAQTAITVPLLNFYSADDSLVAPFEATMLAGYEQGNPLQRTILIDHGEHAYFFDRWWDQEAILTYFKNLLPGASLDGTITTMPTVASTPGGTPMSGQSTTVSATPAQADAQQGPFVCPPPTAVALQSFAAARIGRGVVLHWQTGSEAGVAGFHVYREQGGRRIRLDRALVPARGGVVGTAYSFLDRPPATARVVRYRLEAVHLDGSRVPLGSVTLRR